MKNWFAIPVVAIIAGVAGFVFYHRGAETNEAAQQSAPGEVQAAAPAANPIATTLPEFSLQNRAGEMQSIRSWPGKSMIVNFWATWCGPCRKEIPLLKEIATAKARSNFQVVGVAIDFRDEVLKYADEIKINYPLLIGEQDGIAAADAFGVNSVGLPFTAFTDKQGRIVTLHMGELTTIKMNIILDAVTRVNDAKLTPDQARAAITAQLLKLPTRT